MVYDYTMKNTHEQISFRFNKDLGEKSANLLGQCYAYINSMLNTPIRPDHHQQMLLLSLNKGALATTAIEGNTLTEEDLTLIQSGKDVAPSKRYQQKEIENILNAFNIILDKVVRKKTPNIVTPELIRSFHKMVGENIGEAFGGNPGSFRRKNVIVGNVYRLPSFEKVEELVKRLCEWLPREFHYAHDQNFDEAVLEAIVVHIYIAWIHPFEDGNGRTARLLEFYLLLRAGVPSIASHILSNHYNDTRAEYYRQLQNASESGSLKDFIQYALLGFRDGLEKVIALIHNEQTELTWKNHVHDTTEKMQGEEKYRKTALRLRQLAYYIPADRFVSTDEITILNFRIAKDYQSLSQQTLRRDLDLLVEKDLLKVDKNKYRANHELLRGLMPEASVTIRTHY
jgi:Fic family protein